MQINKNSKLSLIYLLSLVGLALFVLLIIFFIKSNQNNKNNSLSDKSDDILVTQISDKNNSINDKTQDFSFLAPSDWYLEKKNGGGIVLYPNYNATSTTEQKCKIEISVFHNILPNDANAWFENYLKKDPIISIKEINREGLSLPYTDFSFKWTGMLNDINTEIAYVSANNNIYEIAPSVIDIKDFSQNLSCDKYFNEFLKEIKFKNYEK